MDEYKITIEINTDTIKKLHTNKAKLFVCKGVESNTTCGEILIWRIYDSIQSPLNITWDNTYGAFFSDNSLSDKDYSTVQSKSIELSQCLVIDKDDNDSIKNSSNWPDAITIYNQSLEHDYTCGISQLDERNKLSPICAFNLIRRYPDYIIPTQKVALFFATDNQKKAKVYDISRSEGIIVNLNTDKNKKLTYDIIKGWETVEGNQGTTFKIGDSLKRLLIISKVYLKKFH